MAGQSFDTVKTAVDASLGTGAVTSPLWLQLLERGLGFYVAVAGAILITIRLVIAFRDWRAGK